MALSAVVVLAAARMQNQKMLESTQVLVNGIVKLRQTLKL
jgi:hypothetical protein